MRYLERQWQIVYRGKQIFVEEVAERKLDPGIIGRSSNNIEKLLRGEDGRYYLQTVWGWNRPSLRSVANAPEIRKWEQMPNDIRCFTKNMMLEGVANSRAVPLFRYKRIDEKDALVWCMQNLPRDEQGKTALSEALTKAGIPQTVVTDVIGGRKARESNNLRVLGVA